MSELEQMKKELTNQVIECYAPESTRWNRNHTETAEWYFIWSQTNWN